MIRRLLAFIAALATTAALAQGDYPNKPIKLIVPFPPAGGTDTLSRAIAQSITNDTKWTIVVENRPGAGGNIGLDAAAKSPPDGYTIAMGQTANLAVNPALYSSMPYDPLKDFAPVSMVAVTPFALVTHPSFPAANAKEFVALLRANPGKYTFATSGTGATAHLVTELFNAMAQVQARHVPYKGSAPALADVMNGEIGYAIETVAATASHIKSGRVKTFGVSTARRSAALPDVPPLAESAGLPQYDIAGWIGYAAPAGTPHEFVVRLSGEIRKALANDDLKERMVSLGLDAVSTTPEEMAAYMRREQDRYGEIIRNANIRIE